MTALESILLSYLVNTLWQVPLFFAAGWLAARALRSLGPGAEHRVWVTVLILQALLPAFSAIPWDTLRALLNLTTAPLNNGEPHVSVVIGPGTAFGNPHLPAWLFPVISIAYCAFTAFLAARFLWRLHTIRMISRNAAPIALSTRAARHWALCANTFHVVNASLGTSSQIYSHYDRHPAQARASPATLPRSPLPR